MNQNKNRRRNNNENKIQKKVIRCKALNRPVFEHELCAQFSLKVNSNNQNICANCKHSF
jgi:hypothetical protein